MGINLVAINPNDSWAFFIRDEKFFTISPPYGDYDLIEVLEKDIGEAIRLRGFEKCNSVFGDMEEVVRFLDGKYAQARKKRGIDYLPIAAAREMLRWTTDDILLQYLEKVEKEWIPAGDIHHAAHSALVIAPIKQSWNNREIYNRAISILEKCNQIKTVMKKNGGNL